MNWAGTHICGHSVLMGKMKKPWQDTARGAGDVRGEAGRGEASVQGFLWKRGLPRGGVRISREGAYCEAQGDGKG